MFTSIRFSFKLKNGVRILTMKLMSWPTEEKAKEYLLRFSSLPWFAGGVIEEDGEVLYELTPTGSEYVYEPIRNRLKRMAERKDLDSYPTDIFYPAFGELSQNLSFCSV